MTMRRRRKNPVDFSKFTGVEIAAIVGGVGVLGYIAYRLYQANYSTEEQSAENWMDSQSSGSTGLGQFQNTWQGDYIPNSPEPGYHPAGLGPGLETTVIPWGDQRMCSSSTTFSSNTSFCWQNQDNTSVPSVGDEIAVIVQNIDGSSYPEYGTVTESDGTTVTFTGNNGASWNFPLSYIATGLDLIGAAAGF